MTGPEHYREAEWLLGRMTERDLPDVAAVAQVHATLALAAATADPWNETDWKPVLR